CVLCLSFSPDGNTLATGGEDGQLKLWDVRSGREKITLSGFDKCIVLHLAFEAGGKTLAAVGYDSSARVWDVEKRDPLIVLGGGGFTEKNPITHPAAFTQDGRKLVMRDRGVMDLQTGKIVQRCTPSADTQTAAAISADGKSFAFGLLDGRV